MMVGHVHAGCEGSSGVDICADGLGELGGAAEIVFVGLWQVCRADATRLKLICLMLSGKLGIKAGKGMKGSLRRWTCPAS